MALATPPATALTTNIRTHPDAARIHRVAPQLRAGIVWGQSRPTVRRNRQIPGHGRRARVHPVQVGVCPTQPL